MCVHVADVSPCPCTRGAAGEDETRAFLLFQDLPGVQLLRTGFRGAVLRPRFAAGAPGLRLLCIRARVPPLFHKLGSRSPKEDSPPTKECFFDKRTERAQIGHLRRTRLQGGHGTSTDLALSSVNAFSPLHFPLSLSRLTGPWHFRGQNAPWDRRCIPFVLTDC